MPWIIFRPRRWRAILLAAGCGLFVYLLFQLEAGKIVSLLWKIGWVLPMVLGLYTGYLLVGTFALAKCITVWEDVPYADLLAIRLSGESIQYLTFTGPFLAEPTKALLLKDRGLAIARAFAATISEYLIYTFTSAIVALAGLSYLLREVDVPDPISTAAQVVLGVTVIFFGISAFAITRRIYLLGTIIHKIERVVLVNPAAAAVPAESVGESRTSIEAICRTKRSAW